MDPYSIMYSETLDHSTDMLLFLTHWMDRQTLTVVFPQEQYGSYPIACSCFGFLCIYFLDFKSEKLYVYSFIQIFGIYMVEHKNDLSLEDVLQPGENMVAAGYCMYGSSCTVGTIAVLLHYRQFFFKQNSLSYFFFFRFPLII